MAVTEHLSENANTLTEVGGRLAYASSSAAVIAGLTLNEWAAAVGIGVALVTYVTNLVFRLIEHKARMARLRVPHTTDTEDL